MFATWSVNGEPPGHLDIYVADSFYRFLQTWGMVSKESGRCLELGANPYFTTYLIDEYTDLDPTLANFYGSGGEAAETVSLVPPRRTDRVERTYRSHLFNIEEDIFPFESGQFDVVLFCEIIEHLLMDPMHALRQIHRVLSDDGILVLTTPNVGRLVNVFRLVAGENIYDPYSGFGPYGRHNREYTLHELHRLLEFAGFEVESSLTADGHPWEPSHFAVAGAVSPLLSSRRRDLGQYLFVRARCTKPPRDGLPSFLYRSRPAGEIVEYE